MGAKVSSLSHQGARSKFTSPRLYSYYIQTCSFILAPTDFLLLSEKTDGRRDAQIKCVINSSIPDLVLPIRSLKIIRALEYDPNDNKIYWSMDNGDSKTVQRASINGTHVSI